MEGPGGGQCGPGDTRDDETGPPQLVKLEEEGTPHEVESEVRAVEAKGGEGEAMAGFLPREPGGGPEGGVEGGPHGAKDPVWGVEEGLADRLVPDAVLDLRDGREGAHETWGGGGRQGGEIGGIRMKIPGSQMGTYVPPERGTATKAARERIFLMEMPMEEGRGWGWKGGIRSRRRDLKNNEFNQYQTYEINSCARRAQ